jgi:hypothetical protein
MCERANHRRYGCDAAKDEDGQSRDQQADDGDKDQIA